MGFLAQTGSVGENIITSFIFFNMKEDTLPPLLAISG
jgi:hypothetical protein